MKIYEIGTGYTPIPAQMGAATEIVVEELVKSFRNQNIPVELIDIQADDRLPNDLPIIEVPVPKSMSGTDVKLGIVHKLKRVVYSVSLANTLRKILKHSKERVILHFHNQYNLFFFYKLIPAGIRHKACVIYTNHSYIWHDSWNKIEETIRRRYFQEIYCVEHADHVFVLNEQTRENLITHLKVNPARVHLIGNGVNVEVYSVLDQESKRAAKKQWNCEGKKIFIQVGSVCERKNQLTSLKLLTPLMQKDRDVVFCYAGGVIDPQYQVAMEQYAKQQGISDQIRYAGELQPGKQLNCFYNLAEAMVFPSKAEGFSLVIIEAMAAGVPVLIDRNLRFELAEKCLRYSGEEEFADIVKHQILNADYQMGLSAQARQTVMETYSWDRISKDYLAIVK